MRDDRIQYTRHPNLRQHVISRFKNRTNHALPNPDISLATDTPSAPSLPIKLEYPTMSTVMIAASLRVSITGFPLRDPPLHKAMHRRAALVETRWSRITCRRSSRAWRQAEDHRHRRD